MGFGQYYAIVGLLFQVALLVCAIRAYRVNRSQTGLLIMWATLCYVIAASSWWTFNFSAGLVLGGQRMSAHARHTLENSRYYCDQTFQLLFAALMIAALISITHRPSQRGNSNI
jgi:hypothetical protein